VEVENELPEGTDEIKLKNNTKRRVFVRVTEDEELWSSVIIDIPPTGLAIADFIKYIPAEVNEAHPCTTDTIKFVEKPSKWGPHDGLYSTEVIHRSAYTPIFVYRKHEVHVIPEGGHIIVDGEKKKVPKIFIKVPEEGISYDEAMNLIVKQYPSISIDTHFLRQHKWCKTEKLTKILPTFAKLHLQLKLEVFVTQCYMPRKYVPRKYVRPDNTWRMFMLEPTINVQESCSAEYIKKCLEIDDRDMNNYYIEGPSTPENPTGLIDKVVPGENCYVNMWCISKCEVFFTYEGEVVQIIMLDIPKDGLSREEVLNHVIEESQENINPKDFVLKCNGEVIFHVNRGREHRIVHLLRSTEEEKKQQD